MRPFDVATAVLFAIADPVGPAAHAAWTAAVDATIEITPRLPQTAPPAPTGYGAFMGALAFVLTVFFALLLFVTWRERHARRRQQRLVMPRTAR
jgi:hypothetical protein